MRALPCLLVALALAGCPGKSTPATTTTTTTTTQTEEVEESPLDPARLHMGTGQVEIPGGPTVVLVSRGDEVFAIETGPEGDADLVELGAAGSFGVVPAQDGNIVVYRVVDGALAAWCLRWNGEDFDTMATFEGRPGEEPPFWVPDELADKLGAE